MSNNIITLIVFEMKRYRTVPIMIVSAMFLFFSLIMMIAPFTLGMVSNQSLIRQIEVCSIVSETFKVLVPLFCLLFGAGIIAFDIKNQWLKSILARPVSRNDFLFAKIASAAILIFALMLLMSTIPVLVISIFVSVPVVVNWGNLLLLHLLYLLEIITYLSICVSLSCIVPSFINIFIFAVWMFLDSAAGPAIATLLWDNNLAQIITDFFFPDGMKLAATAIASSKPLPTEQFMWGLAELFGFLSLAFFLFSKTNIDKGTD